MFLMKLLDPLSSTLGDVGLVCNTYGPKVLMSLRALNFILVMCFRWNALHFVNYFPFYEACSRSFDKFLQALVGIDIRGSLVI